MSPFRCYIVFSSDFDVDSVPVGYGVKLFFDASRPWKKGEKRDCELEFESWEDAPVDASDLIFLVMENGVIGTGEFSEAQEGRDYPST